MPRSTHQRSEASRDPRQCILPPGLLRRVLEAHPELGPTALATWQVDSKVRVARASAAARQTNNRPITFARTGGTPQRTIYDQKHSESQTPGKVARAEGQAASSDKAVNQAYDGLGATYAFYWDRFQRDSIDAHGLPMLGLVHYGQKYDNAFWDGSGHMFFGDGDGKMLTQTTAGMDVIGHELTHGVTQNEANLDYSGQSGALNESMSDCLGITVKQYALKQGAAKADWLIGADIVGPTLKPALRSMKAPGTANPHDDQPADMDGYVQGGDVHTNSGIPNRAFATVAITLGGNTWDAAAPIWYAALCDKQLSSTATFSEFAAITLKQAERLYGSTSKEADAVHVGWDTVKVPLSTAGKVIALNGSSGTKGKSVARKAGIKAKPAPKM
jgi:Zn-dependent metalloprotease